MNNYRFILEPYKGMQSRHTCPSCGHRKEFTKYIDKITGEYLPDNYGKCNRADKCGHHESPYKDGYSQMIWKQEDEVANYRQMQPVNLKQVQVKKDVKPISSIRLVPFAQSLKSYDQNNFVKFLIKLFGSDITTKLIERYYIGTSKHWNNSTIFWQIDISGKIRGGKIMLYNSDTGKRTDNITWVHKALKQPEFNLKQCFFGEHLLKDKTKPVAIVESEKTAIIASVYSPQFIWIAAGNLHGLNAEKCEVLRGRDVILYPDLSKPKEGKPTAFKVWSDKAKEFSNITNFTVNELLETKASEAARKEGCDRADYLINIDYKDFIEPETIEPQIFIPNPFKWEPIRQFLKPEINPPISWSNQISDLEKYFSAIQLPTNAIKLNPCSNILDVRLFIDSHFQTLKRNKGKDTFIPFLHRLQDLKQYFENNKHLQE